MIRSTKVLALVVILGLFNASAAMAHKVTIFAWAEGDTVHTESKFSGGKMVKDGKVAVFDDSGALLLEGSTNGNGEFSFTAPKRANLNIVLTAGMGHQNSWLLTAAELGAEAPPAAAAASAAVETPPEPVSSPPPSGLTAQEVEAILARQLDQRLQPLARMIAASQEKGPSIGDVVGGLGYIIGLVGLGAYVRYRKDRRPS